MNRPLLLVTVNSPGEIAFWLSPFLEELEKIAVPPCVWAFIPPCQFRSGREEMVIRSLPLVERVFNPQKTVEFCFGGDRVTFPPRGLVLFLGGDLFYARLLKFRSRYPLWVYDGYPRRSFGVDVYLARFQEDLHRVSFTKKIFVGDLLRSFVERSVETLTLPPGSPRFLFLPGSRSFAYQYLVPFFLRCAEVLSSLFPQSLFLIAFPPYYSPGDVSCFRELSERFLPFFGKTSSLIAASDLVFMVPGSSNLEVLYRKKRGLVLVPFFQEAATRVPVMGAGEFLGRMPLWGKIVKRWILRRMVRSSRFLSLPNQILGKAVFPELRGEITVEGTVQEALRLLEQEAPDFPEEVFPSKAVERLVGLVMEELYG
ncbi:hypothetical protein ACP6EK_06735 [Candidatus Caldatribacterium sp. SIUC1]|uniref:hypothetical protein n=1 Tax=Candidatus Caldatribacterium sp. SIUC1 TaxID=3418365 RepID=UPI003F68EAB2